MSLVPVSRSFHTRSLALQVAASASGRLGEAPQAGLEIPAQDTMRKLGMGEAPDVRIFALTQALLSADDRLAFARYFLMNKGLPGARFINLAVAHSILKQDDLIDTLWKLIDALGAQVDGVERVNLKRSEGKSNPLAEHRVPLTDEQFEKLKGAILVAEVCFFFFFF